MKLNFARFETSQEGLAAVPMYPIAKWNVKDSDKDEGTFRTVKLELRTNPTASDSVKFSSYFKVFENGTPEQWCRWREDLAKVFKGLNLNTGPNQIGMVRHLLAGQALDTFSEYFGNGAVSETVDHMRTGLKKVAATIFPDNAVANQKQYMRHSLKKPNKLTARETATRLQQLNAWLEYYPADGQDPAAVITKLDESEIRDIYYRLLPTVWRRKMDENVQFDRAREGLRGLVDYAERLETSEAVFDGKTKENGSSNHKSRGGSQKPEGTAKNKGKSETGRANSDGNRLPTDLDKDCLIHGPNCGHASHRCRILKEHAQKVKGQFQASFKDKGVHKKSSPAKPWKRDDKERTYTKKEVQMLLQRNETRAKEAKLEIHAMETEPIQDDFYDPYPGDFKSVEELDDQLDSMYVE